MTEDEKRVDANQMMIRHGFNQVEADVRAHIPSGGWLYLDADQRGLGKPYCARALLHAHLS